MSGLDLLVVGDVNADLVLRGGDLVPSFGQREQLVDHAQLVLGGSAGIVAAGAARLGLRVAIAGCVGDDALGRAMLEALDGVDVSAVRTVAEPTGVSVALARPGDRAVLTALGALASLRAEDVPDALLAAARHVHVASPFLQPGLDVAAIAARAAGTTSLDPGWDPHERWELAWEGFDVLLPNAQEARRLAGEEDVHAAALQLAGQGPLVVVKLGADGALAARQDPRGDVVISARAPAHRPGRRHRRGRLLRRRLHRRAARGGRSGRGARARLRVRRAEHARGGRDRRPADAGRGAILPRVIAFVSASPSIDRTHVVDALTPGEIHRPQRVVAVAGGKALNAARAAHALGADVHAIALLGGHAGRWVAAALEEEGVTCDAVPGPGETRVCLSVSDGEGLTEFYEPGPALAAEHWAALEAAAARIAAGAAWVGVAGSLPPGAPADAAARLLRVAREAGARVALDVSGEALRLGLEAGPDFVKVNAGEAAELGFETAAALREAGRARRSGDSRRRSRTAPTAWSSRRPTGRPCARRRRASAPIRSAAATRRSAASSPRSTPAPRGPTRSRAPPAPRRLTRRFRARGGWAFPERLPAGRVEQVQVAVVDGEREALARVHVDAPAHPRREPRRVVVGEQAPLVRAQLLDLDRGRVDAERHERLVAERLHQLGLDLQARELRVGPRARQLERPRPQPEHDVAARPREVRRQRQEWTRRTRRARRRSAPRTRFMAGDPMKAATNRFTGRWKSCCGSPNCCSTPSRSTATRWPSVIASTWSWVT